MRRITLLLLFAVCFSMATWLGPRFDQMRGDNLRSGSVMAVLMGDSRRIFANHFFAKADAYFHDGHYPTIFDRAPKTGAHMTHREHEHSGEHEGDAEDECFVIGPPKDWVERFGRHFVFTEHTHLQGNGQEREILPWLKISADLDPYRIETYVTAAYWLRKRLDKADEAAQFLRQGLAANPDSYEILLELGRVYDENKKQPQIARTYFERSLDKWHKQKHAGKKVDDLLYMETLGHLVTLEERDQNYPQLIKYLEELKKISPNPADIEKQLIEARAKLETHPSGASSK